MDKTDILMKMLISCAVSNYKIAKTTGISPTTIANYKTGKTKPTTANANTIIQYLNSITDASTPNTAPQRDEQECIPLIPVEAVAGVLSGNSATVMDYECEHYTIPLFKGAEFLIQVSGDSMQPKYYSGDIVACRQLRIDTFFQWNRTYVVGSEQGVLIKRILPGHDDQYVSLVSENPNYPPFELSRADIYSIALVVGVVRAE